MHKLRGGQRVEVRYIMHQSGVDQLTGQRFTKTFDVHRVARKMQQGVLESTGTGDVVATPRDRLRITPYRTATGRALALDVLIEVEWLDSVRALLFYNADDDLNNSDRF